MEAPTWSRSSAARRHEPVDAADPQWRERQLHGTEPQQAEPRARSEKPAGAGGDAQACGEVGRVRRSEPAGRAGEDGPRRRATSKAINPKPIYTSVSGFGPTGPDRRRAGVNLIIEAFSGVLSVTGACPARCRCVRACRPPTYSVRCSRPTRRLASAGRSRPHLGEGRVADISLVEASIAAAAWRRRSIWKSGQGVPRPMGNRHRLTAAVPIVRDRRPAPIRRVWHAERYAVSEVHGKRSGLRNI